jgi:hypothetical protein
MASARGVTLAVLPLTMLEGARVTVVQRTHPYRRPPSSIFQSSRHLTDPNIPIFTDCCGFNTAGAGGIVQLLPRLRPHLCKWHALQHLGGMGVCSESSILTSLFHGAGAFFSLCQGLKVVTKCCSSEAQFSFLFLTTSCDLQQFSNAESSFVIPRFTSALLPRVVSKLPGPRAVA